MGQRSVALPSARVRGRQAFDHLVGAVPTALYRPVGRTHAAGGWYGVPLPRLRDRLVIPRQPATAPYRAALCP